MHNGISQKINSAQENTQDYISINYFPIPDNSDLSSRRDSIYLESCRKILRNFFLTVNRQKSFFDFILTVGSCITIIPIIFLIIRHFIIPKPSQIIDTFRKLKINDSKFIRGIDILPRFGKKTTQLVGPSVTLFSPAIEDHDDDEFSYKCELLENDDDSVEYIYTTESVTKVYTFPDQLFIYHGIWDYTGGRFVHEETDAFFFKDITNISTEHEYEKVKVDKIPFKEYLLAKGIKGLLKFTFIAIIFVWIATFVWHLIDRPSVEMRNIESRMDLIVNNRLMSYELTDTEKKFKKEYKLAGKKEDIKHKYREVFKNEEEKRCESMQERHWNNVMEPYAWIGSIIAISIPVLYLIILWLAWCVLTAKYIYVRYSDTITIKSSSGDDISITMLCDEWLDANHGVLTGERSDAEKTFHVIRKMIEEKKVEYNG